MLNLRIIHINRKKLPLSYSLSLRKYKSFIITNYDTHTLMHPAHYVVNVSLIATQ